MSESPFPELAAARAKVALLLAHGATVTNAAGAAGLHRSTVYRWIKTDDNFSLALHQGRAECTLALRDDLRELSEMALRALVGVLTDPLASPAVRLKASMFILNRPEPPKQGWAMPSPLLPEEQLELTEDNPVIAEDYQRLREHGAPAPAAAPPAAEAESAAAPESAGATECDTMRRNSVFSRPAARDGRPPKMPPASHESPRTGPPDGEPAENLVENAA